MAHNYSVYEQADHTCGYPIRYSWLFDAPYTMRKRLIGWKWIRGDSSTSGCYVTSDYALAKNVADVYGKTIESNGTHAYSNAPMYGQTLCSHPDVNKGHCPHCGADAA